MPKRKITPAVFERMNDAYMKWDPQDMTADELFRQFGISKQAFFAERRRRGLPPIHRPSAGEVLQHVKDKPQEAVQSMEVMLELLVQARLEIQQLRTENEQLRQQHHLGGGGSPETDIDMEQLADVTGG